MSYCLKFWIHARSGWLEKNYDLLKRLPMPVICLVLDQIPLLSTLTHAHDQFEPLMPANLYLIR